MSEKSSSHKVKVEEGSYKVTIQGNSIIQDNTIDVVYKKGNPEDAKILSFNFIEDTERTEKCLKH